jgi:hypothetical protein
MDRERWLAEPHDLASLQDVSCWAPIPRVKTPTPQGLRRGQFIRLRWPPDEGVP